MTSPGETLVNSVPNADIVAQEASRESVIQRSLQYIGRVASRTALSLSLAISGGALTGTASEIGTPSPAAATGETGGYPDWNKPCVAQGPNFGRTEGSGYWCNSMG